MSDAKIIIDQYAAEAQALRTQLAEVQAALVMLVAKVGRNEIDLPASLRQTATTIEAIDLRWSNRDNFLARGSLTIKVKRRRKESPNGHKEQ